MQAHLADRGHLGGRRGVDGGGIDQIATLVSGPGKAFLHRATANRPWFQHAANGDDVRNSSLGAGSRHGVTGGSPDPVRMNERRTRGFDRCGDITAGVAARIQPKPRPVTSRRLTKESRYRRRNRNLRLGDPSGKESYAVASTREMIHQCGDGPWRTSGGCAEVSDGMQDGNHDLAGEGNDERQAW